MNFAGMPCPICRKPIQKKRSTYVCPNCKDNEQRAWELYCEETAGDMDVRDSWDRLPPNVQELYLRKVATI